MSTTKSPVARANEECWLSHPGFIPRRREWERVRRECESHLEAVLRTRVGIARPTQLDQILEALGKPTHAEARVVRNPHVDGDEDEWRTLKFPALTLLVVLVGRDPNHLLVSQADVDSPSRILPDNLRVGDPSDQFIGSLGPPGRKEEGRLTYYCNETDDVVLEILDSRVRSVRWSYYVD